MPRIRSANISQNILTGTLNVSTINVSTITLANGQDLAGTGNLAYNQANAARDQANTARDQANSAYLAANNANLLLGGVITGTLNVTQDIIVGGNVYLEGNTTFINVATYSVEDSLIYLASNNSLTDSVDIGFVGAKNTSGTFSHTGLARDATDGKWKLFDGLPDSGHVGNVIDFNNSYLATLVANVEANTLSVVNGVSGNVNFDTGTLFIDSVGNEVGIGTTSPEEQLHIFSGNLLIGTNVNTGFSAAQFRIGATGADVGFQFSQAMDNPGAPRVFFSKARGTLASPTTVSTSDQTGSLRFTGYVGSTGGYVQNAQIAAEVDGAVSDTLTGLGGRLSLWTRQIGGVLTERLRIDNAGNVGIGTINPTQKLQVTGGSILIDQDQALRAGASGNWVIGSHLTSNDVSIGSTAIANDIRFNSTPGTQVIIKAGGNVGIGTTSPGHKLVVNGISTVTGDAAPGGTGISMADYATGGYAWIQSFSSRPLYINPLGNNLIFNRDGGNIGIGTTSPGTKLDIASTQGSGLTMRYDATTAYRALITPYWNSSTDTRIDFAINSVANQTPSVYMSVGYNGGYVGIGTTSPVQKLHIEGNPAIGTTGTEDVLILGRALSGGVSFQQAASLKLGRYQNAGGAFESYTRLDFALRDNSSSSNYNTNTTVMTLTNAGNVGISTTSPSTRLHVVTGNSAEGEVRIENSSASFSSGINFYTGSQRGFVGWRGTSSTSPFNVSGMYLINFDNSNLILGTNNTERLRIDTSGNVGIGTTSPLNLFHVSGSSQNVRFSNFSTDSAGLLISYQNSSNHGLHLMYRPNDATCYIDSTYQASTGTVYGDLIFRQNIAGTMTPRITIKADGGNVGINTTSPAGKLDVWSEIWVNGNKALSRVSSINSGITYMVLGNGGSSGTAALSGYDLRTPNPQHFINAGMSFGFTSYDLNNTDTNGWADYIHFSSYTDSSGGSPNIFLINKASSGVKVARQTFNSSSNYNAGTIYTLNFTSASDASVKEDVQNITGALDKIMQLRPVTFKWTNEYILNGMSRNSNEHTFDPETNQVIIPEEKTVNVGLIAQEVEAVIPTVVHQENVKLKGAENYLKNISYDKLVPHLIAALQELKREFDEYKQTHP